MKQVEMFSRLFEQAVRCRVCRRIYCKCTSWPRPPAEPVPAPRESTLSPTRPPGQ